MNNRINKGRKNLRKKAFFLIIFKTYIKKFNDIDNINCVSPISNNINANNSLSNNSIGALFNNVEDITRAINNLNNLVNSMGTA